MAMGVAATNSHIDSQPYERPVTDFFHASFPAASHAFDGLLPELLSLCRVQVNRPQLKPAKQHLSADRKRLRLGDL
jgi:hypothetical protein